MNFPRETLIRVIEDVRRAPTVHNVQPFRIDVSDDELRVFEDSRRQLKIADPERADQELSLGVFIEALRLAFSIEGIGVDIRETHELKTTGAGLALRARLGFTRVDAPDPLAYVVKKRTSFRGQFSKESSLSEARKAEIMSFILSEPGAKLLWNADHDWAEQYDRSSAEFYYNTSYWRELYDWMRFTAADPNYERDGLNAEAMALSSLEAMFAKTLLKPNIFRVLLRLKIGGALASESAQINSSAGHVALIDTDSSNRIKLGRTFYRIWLNITRAGLSACPMSAMVDSKAGQLFLQNHFSTGGKRVVALWRIGDSSHTKTYYSPRLPVEEYLMKARP